MTRVIDADTHFMEPAGVYEDYIAPAQRDLALRVERDDRGWPFLSHQGRPLMRLDVQTPGRVDLIGEQSRRYAAGENWYEVPAPIPDLWDPKARIENLQRNGVDSSIVFPNMGLAWQHQLANDLPALCANMSAYNRWLRERLPECGEALYPVALVDLQDLDWLQQELELCAAAGLKLAMVAPQPVGGRALAHPDFDRVWAAFQDLDMGICFHVSNFQLPLDPAWYALDPEPANKLMDTAFLYLAPAVALASLIIHGKLEQFPGLRFGVVELSAGWVPGFLMHLDGAWEFYRSQRGRPLSELSVRPSEYFKRQVRVNAFALEGAANLMDMVGSEVFMWGSDYPHSEGMSKPSWSSYLKVQPRKLSSAEQAALSGDNAAYLLGLTR